MGTATCLLVYWISGISTCLVTWQIAGGTNLSMNCNHGTFTVFHAVWETCPCINTGTSTTINTGTKS